MTKWTAEKDAFSNGLIDTGITVFHVCDLTSEEETLRLLTDIADRHNIDVDALTAERDELRGKLDDVRMGIGCARGQRTTQYCADLTQRDEVITKLLDLTAPHVDDFGNRQWWQYKRPEQMHARACEIAGRTE